MYISDHICHHAEACGGTLCVYSLCASLIYIYIYIYVYIYIY